MRDYLIVFIVLASLPIGLFRPFYGLLVYAWIGYMYPHEWAWSFARTFPVAKVAGVSVIIGTLISGGLRLRALREKENVLMILLWMVFTFTSVFAVYQTDAWGQWKDVTKMIAIGLLTSMLLTDRHRLRYFVLVVAFSLGFYSFKGGIFSALTGGEFTIWGPGNSIIGANNNIGLALNMTLPVLWFAAAREQRWLKRVLLAGFLLTIPTIVFTYSRASQLTMPIIILAIAWKSKHRVAFLAAILIVAILAVPFFPQRFWDRVGTVATYEEDTSAMSRIDNWVFCWRVALDRPLTGAGFNYHNLEVFAQYAPDFLLKYGGKVWDSHSIYFSMLAGHGFPGFFVFMAMILCSMWTCRRMQHAARRVEGLKWIEDYSNMIQISLLALLVNGAFVNMEFFELVYQWVGVVAGLNVMCSYELGRVKLKEPVPSWLSQPQFSH